MLRCRRWAAGVEQPDERLLVLGPHTLDGLNQLSISITGGGAGGRGGRCRVPPVGGVERGADLVDPLGVE